MPIEDGDLAVRIARAVISKTLKGNILAIKEITDRIEGKARQAIDFAVEDMPDLNLTVRFVDSDGNGRPPKEEACPTCGGSGCDPSGSGTCQACRGSLTRK